MRYRVPPDEKAVWKKIIICAMIKSVCSVSLRKLYGNGHDWQVEKNASSSPIKQGFKETEQLSRAH
ncbi:hypothetical protein CGZ60_05115 [Neisseria animalis]|nr:hypothetical protein CGZ60_05115 [Neisseria animalis]